MHPDPPHPIIDRPHEYSIADLRYHVGLDGTEPFIDMALQRGQTVRRLRFLWPRQLVIEDGFPVPTSGMEILDVSQRQLGDLRIRVGDCEAGFGAITFWAKDVIDLDLPGTAPTEEGST